MNQNETVIETLPTLSINLSIDSVNIPTTQGVNLPTESVNVPTLSVNLPKENVNLQTIGISNVSSEVETTSGNEASSAQNNMFLYIRNSYFFVESTNQSSVDLTVHKRRFLASSTLHWDLMYETERDFAYHTNQTVFFDLENIYKYFKYTEKDVKKKYILSTMNLVKTRLGLVRVVNGTKQCAQYETKSFSHYASVDLENKNFEMYEDANLIHAYIFKCVIYYSDLPCIRQEIEPKEFSIDGHHALSFSTDNQNYTIPVDQYIPTRTGFRICQSSLMFSAAQTFKFCNSLLVVSTLLCSFTNVLMQK